MRGPYAAGASLTLPDRVTVIEVLPRDGLQSLDRTLDTRDKVWLIDQLVRAGLQSIEVTAFAHPRVIPQLADAERVVKEILPRLVGEEVDLRALVPNLTGAMRAADAGVTTIVALMTATESYSRKNQNRTVSEVLDEIARISTFVSGTGTALEVNIGTAFYDPYEGPTPYERLRSSISRVRELGIEAIGIAASVGLADPAETFRRCRRLINDFPGIDLGLHVHNTNGMGLANVLAALQAGVKRFESSMCGIGGGIVMPDGMSSLSGNVPTEDLVQMLDAMDVVSGLEPTSMVTCAIHIGRRLDLPVYSYSARGGTADQILNPPRVPSVHNRDT